MSADDVTSAQVAIAAARRHEDPGHRRRETLRVTFLALSVGVPIVFVAYANHVSQSTGINWLRALGALVALSLVLAASVATSRG